jgi:hypothetical protein
MSKNELIHGLKAFTTYLKRSPSRFSQSPVLLIESHPLLDANNNGKLQSSPPVADACRQVSFLLSQQLGLRTVSVHASPEYPFPVTPTDPDTIPQLAQRTGASTVVGVGSGTAMDLAKAVSSNSQFEATVLIPATYGAVLVAGMSHALLLDKTEEMLVATEFQRQDDDDDTAIRSAVTVVTADASLMPGETRDTAILAAVSIVLAALLQDNSSMSDRDRLLRQDLLKNLVHHLDQPPTIDQSSHEILCQLLLEAGSLAQYGIITGARDRSIPIALLASLLPTTFSASDSMAFLASTVPSLDRMLHSSRQVFSAGKASSSILNEKQRKLVPQIVTMDPSHNLISLLHANQALWKCHDANDKLLRDCLKDHLLIL